MDLVIVTTTVRVRETVEELYVSDNMETTVIKKEKERVRRIYIYL
jgi:hypothetical protein